MRNPYETLGVPPAATDEEIKSAYIKLIKDYHPDKYQDDPFRQTAEEITKEINRAYTDLMANRQAYANSGPAQTGQDASKQSNYKRPYRKAQERAYYNRAYDRGRQSPPGSRFYLETNNGLTIMMIVCALSAALFVFLARTAIPHLGLSFYIICGMAGFSLVGHFAHTLFALVRGLVLRTIPPGYRPLRPVSDFYRMIDAFCDSFPHGSGQSSASIDREKIAIISLIKPGDIFFFNASFKIEAFQVYRVLNDRLILNNSEATMAVSYDTLLYRKRDEVFGVVLQHGPAPR